MNRKLKLGLALVAAMALTAMMASAAMAAKGFTSSVGTTTTLSGTQEGNHEFTAGPGFGAIKCTEATFSGTGSGTFQASQDLTPKYAGCKDSLGRVVHVEENSLTYTFTVTGTDADGTPTGDVEVHGSVKLTVTGSTHCTVTVVDTTKKHVNAVKYHVLGNNLLVTTKALEVHTTLHGNFFACGVSGTYPITATAGTYTGNTTVTGKGPLGEAATLGVDHS